MSDLTFPSDDEDEEDLEIDDCEQALHACGDTGEGWCAHEGSEHCEFRCSFRNNLRPQKEDNDASAP